MNQINALATGIEKTLADSPRTDNRRQIAAAVVVDHNNIPHIRLLPIAVVDFYGDKK